MGSNNVNNSTAHDGDDKGSVSLCDLPVELVIEIVAGLPARYLVLVCRLVCKQWRCIVDSQSLWVQKCHIDSVAVPTMKDLDYRHLHFHNPYGRNLLKNWNGEGKLLEIIDISLHDLRLQTNYSLDAGV